MKFVLGSFGCSEDVGLSDAALVSESANMQATPVIPTHVPKP